MISKLKKNVEDLKVYRAAALEVALNKENDVEYNRIFLKYFKSESVRNRVIDVIKAVGNMESAEAFCENEKDTTCADNAIAWTFQNSTEFHVCPNFFNSLWHGTIENHNSEASSIILHELTHCFGTDDFAYGEHGCSQLDHTKAAENGDTYRLFAMHCIYYLNNRKNGIVQFNPNVEIDFRVIPFKDKVVKRNSQNESEETYSAEPISVKSSESIESAESAESVESTESIESAESVESAKPIETTKSTESAKPTETAKTTESAKPTETAKATESAKPTKTAKTTESAKPTETAKSTESDKPTENVKSAETIKTAAKESLDKQNEKAHGITLDPLEEEPLLPLLENKRKN